MAAKVLVIGATGRVGSHVVKEFEKNSDGITLRLSSSRPEVAEKWRAEGKEAAVLDLNDPSTFAAALANVDRVFLLTGYTSDMLFQSKRLVDAAKEAGVNHIVHLGVFTSRQDLIPHFTWHDLVETYIEASGITWTHLHPNVITDSVLITDPPMEETGYFGSFFKDIPMGWVCSADIAAVAAAVLREGPEKHSSKNYWLSVEVLTSPEIATILSEVSGREIKYVAHDVSVLADMVSNIPSVPVRAYMESAVITMKLATTGKLQSQTVVRDDIQTVLGRPGTTMKQWAECYFKKES
ncbi:NmrA family NAD(P)-binding protein [Pectobacterium brasiliense]|uniref:NmrA family NAD(P)-binding protein n=1 Tax=Pectobacterium brasiliense TaxID=180957 RepID=UPI0030CF40BD